ncbi:siderophore-interacting protein [soil metagenome]
MVVNESRFRTERFPMAFRALEVLRVERVTPKMVRVTFGGDGLTGFQSLSPDDHLKVIFPTDVDAKPVLPEMTEKGWNYPEGAARPVMRDYTPRRFDSDAGELDIDFFIHGEGPASSWASQAKVGQFIGTAGPRGSHIVNYDFDWYLFCGDETSIPSIARRLSELPAGVRAFTFIEVANHQEEQLLPTAANATLAWILRDEAGPGEENLIQRALQWFEFPAGEGYTWATGEANSLRSLRRYLLNERGLSKEYTSFSGHWKKGTADFDHHEEIGD